MSVKRATFPKGRPTHFTPERVKKLLEGLETGLTRQAAAGLIDTDQQTVWYWMKTEPGFAEQVEIAEQRAEARFTAVIARAANAGDWRAARYWLAHRRRRDWGDQLHVQLDVEIRQLIDQLTGTTAESKAIEVNSVEVPQGEDEDSEQDVGPFSEKEIVSFSGEQVEDNANNDTDG